MSDLNLGARTLLCARETDRAKFIKTLLEQAHTADKYRKRMGKAHPEFGNGTLSDACGRYGRLPMPDRCDPQYLRCLGDVIKGILDLHKDQHP
ncbi:DUF7742 family protein [Yoonia sp. MH D7]